MKAKKRFGQNFLIDGSIVTEFIGELNPSTSERFVEIGPGHGSLTEALLPLVKQLDVIELDNDLIPVLTEQFGQTTHFSLHHQDALLFQLTDIVAPDNTIRLVGNLPYNISTPLLFHYLQQSTVIDDMHFLLQREVVQRICAKPGNKSYGRLSVMTQYYCQTKALFEVPPEAFRPPPKVTSQFVRLIPYQSIPHRVDDEQVFAEVVQAMFSQRRKTVYNTLKTKIDKQSLSQAPVDTTLRPEALSLEEIVSLTNFIIANQ